jgi:hypothetical protein
VTKSNSFFRTWLKKNRWFLAVIPVVIVAEVFLFTVYPNQLKDIVSYFRRASNPTEGILLFSSTDCPQCVKVDAFLKQNKVADNILFTELQVSKITRMPTCWLIRLKFAD